MATFAKIGAGNIVEQVVSVHNDVITDNDGNEQEQLGVDFLNNLYGSADVWKQTSYNTKSGVHKLGGTPFRKNHASKGMLYDESRDAFIIMPKPFASWVLNEDTCYWEAPIEKPLDKPYTWNEENQSWDPTE